MNISEFVRKEEEMEEKRRKEIFPDDAAIEKMKKNARDQNTMSGIVMFFVTVALFTSSYVAFDDPKILFIITGAYVGLRIDGLLFSIAMSEVQRNAIVLRTVSRMNTEMTVLEASKRANGRGGTSDVQ